MSVAVSKLGYLGMRTRDLDGLIAYYTDILSLKLVERTPTQAYLTTGPDHHCLAIETGDQDGRARLGLEIQGTLDAAEAALKELGMAAERRSDPDPGIAEALVITEPDGAPVHLFEGQAASGHASTLDLCPRKLGHVAAFVPDMPKVQRFYEDILGFRWSDTVGDFFVFLRCNADHHAVNFMQSEKRSGLHHFAFEARDFVHLKDILDHFAAHDVRLLWGPGRHGAGHNVFSYHRDPDGNIVEVFTEIDVIYDEEAGHWEPRPWHETFPQGPRVWEVDVASANKWGPVNPELLDH